MSMVAQCDEIRRALSMSYHIKVAYTRTASDMDGTLHTDLAGFENIRDIKKVL